MLSGYKAPMALRAIALAVLAVALAAPATVSGASSGAAADVRAVLLEQSQLFKQGKWRAMYATYTPRFRRSCPYSKFVSQQREGRRILGMNFQLRGIRVRVETARRAIAAYSFVRNGKTIASVAFRDRDVYTRIGSRWYDELDRVSAC